MGPVEEDYIETVLTCEGDFYDPAFHTQLLDFSNRLQHLITTEDKQKLIIKKVEPWNSVKVTFNIPKEAAIRLKHLAEQGDQTLRQLGVLAVQIEGDRVISLTFAGKNNETTEVVFHTAGAHVSTAGAVGASSLFDVSGSDEPGPSNVEATRKNIAHYLSQQGGAGNIFDSILNHGASNEKSHSDPLSIQRQHGQFPFGSPNRSPSAIGGQVPFPPGRSPTGFPSPSASQLQPNFPSPGSGRSHTSPGSPKFSTPPPQVLNPNSPGARQGQVNFSLPFPHGNANVNNLQRIVSAGGKDITSSSPLLVNLLQSDVAAGHFNNLPQHRSPFVFEHSAPAVKRKRRPRKNKDGSPKVPKMGDGDDTSIPLPGTFPGISSQPQMENRVPPMGVEAALYNVPSLLANSTGTETRVSVTPPSGAQVHTPPLVERSHANQGGPLSNQVSPNSSGTLSVSTPSPVRTTPDRSLGSSGMQQMINPYTGQLESVENSPSERIATKFESAGDNSALDVPPQLQPPPNPLVALENRLAAGSHNLSLPSQLSSSPRTIDSSVNRSEPNTAQITTAGTMVSSPHKTTMPPVSIPVSDSMQSKMTLPVSMPGVPHHARPGGPLMTSSQGGPQFQPSLTSSAPRGMTVPSSSGSNVRHQGPTEMHTMSRHHHHFGHRLPGMSHNGPGNAPSTLPSESRQLPVGMGHPELRLRMPQHHQAGMPPQMGGENLGMPNFPHMPRSQGPAISGVPPLQMHGADPSLVTSRGMVAGHPRMPHPHHLPPGYYQHMQQRARMPITNTVSAAHMMTSNPPPRLSHAPPGSTNSVIASQLMRPTLAASSSLGMSVPSATTVGSAQMTHPAIASQLSQNSSSPTKVPLPNVDSKAPSISSVPGETESTTTLVTESVTKKEQQPTAIPANETDMSKNGESPGNPSRSPSGAGSPSKQSASISHTNSDKPVDKLSSVIESISCTKAATSVTVSNSEGSSSVTSVSAGDEPGKSEEKTTDSVQASSHVTNSTDSDVTTVCTEVINANTEQSGATENDEKTETVVESGDQTKPSDTKPDLKQENETSSKPVQHEATVGDQGNSSPLPELGTSVASCSQDSDSPPTTSSPGDSDGIPVLENCHESKLTEVSKLQPSPPQVRTTLSAIAMHNDLHSLVRGSNGASTGEASPVSDNLSSTSQQNYGQSPLGNSVGLHMNHDSELSSQSFDDNSSTPPHAPIVAGPTLSAAMIRENHNDGATKSKDNSNSTSKESLPKDPSAATVPETKNIVTIGYAVSHEPVLNKELADARFNPSGKALDDIPFLKKPSDDLNEETVSRKGVSVSEDFLEEKLKGAETIDSMTKGHLEENISKESLNYQGQVPLFSKTMETCDLNPGGPSSPNDGGNDLPVNGDVNETEIENTKCAIVLPKSSNDETIGSEQSGSAAHSKSDSSSSSLSSKDAEVPGVSVSKKSPPEVDKEPIAVEDKKDVVQSEEKAEVTQKVSEDLENICNKNTGDDLPAESPASPKKEMATDTSGSSIQKENDKDSMTEREETKTPMEADQPQTAFMDEESQVKPEAAAPGPNVAVTTTASTPSQQHTVQTQPIELNKTSEQSSSCGPRLKNGKETEESTDTCSVENVKEADVSTTLKDPIPVPVPEHGKAVGSDLVKPCTDTKTIEPSETASLVPHKALESDSGQESTHETKSEVAAVEPKKISPVPESVLPVVAKEIPVLSAVKYTDESEGKDSKNAVFAQVTIATTQLPSRTNSVESKLSVAVVSNSPPSVASTIMSKSISPVIKAVSSSKPVDIVTSVSVPSTVTVTTNTAVSTSGSVLYTSSIPLPVVTSVVRPGLPQVSSSVIMSTVNSLGPSPTRTSDHGKYQKVSPTAGTRHIPVSSAVMAQMDKHVGISASVPALSPKSNVLVSSAQSRTNIPLPMKAKVCIVTTVGNTKVAIHTLNSVAEPRKVHHLTTTQRALIKPGLIQTVARVQNAMNDNASKSGTGTSIMIRDITRPKDQSSDASGSGDSRGEEDILKPKFVDHMVAPKDIMMNSKHVEKLAGSSNKVVHYNMQHGHLRNPVQSGIPNMVPISKSPETKNTLHDHIDSIVNASRSTNQTISRVPVVSSVGNPKGVALNCLPGETSPHTAVNLAIKQSESVFTNAGDSQHPQVMVGQAGRATGQVATAVRSNQISATSNLDSGTATAAIQAVAAHVKAAQGAASQVSGSSPPEQQKRQSKGISILKPLYDKEFELDDNEMDAKVVQIPVQQKKSVHEPQSGARSGDDNHPKATVDTTAFSIAQILDHAKRAMAEEKLQKEQKGAVGKEKSKGNAGKGVKMAKQVKSTPAANKVPPTASVPNPVAHDFPFSSNAHLSNFVQKSKQTPAVTNSTKHTTTHPIMAPEFHLNLTESVQKVMQAIPGSDALSPPPCPPKVVRPGSVFSKFGEEKQEPHVEDQEVSPQSSTTVMTTAATPSSTHIAVSTVPVTTAVTPGSTHIAVSTVSVSTPATTIAAVTTSGSVSPYASAPVILHRAIPSQPIVVSAVSSLSPGSRTITVTSPLKTVTPSVVTPPRKTPTPPAAMSALRNTPTPHAAVVPSAQHILCRKTPTPPAATVPPMLARKAPTPPAAFPQPHTNARVVSPHNAVSRNTPTPPFNRNTPTPPGTSTVIHSRSPHSTPPAKELPKVKGPGVKFEIMPQPHGASTIVVIKSDNKDPTPPATSDATQTIILGHKDIIRKTTLSSGKADNVTVITTHKPETLRKVAPTIIVPSSAGNTSAITLSQMPIHKHNATAVLTPKGPPTTQWKRVEIPQVRNIVPQMSRVITPVMKSVATPVMKNVALQSRIPQSKPITAITVVNPVQQMLVGTTVAALGTPTTASIITTSPKLAVGESQIQAKKTAVEPPMVGASPVRVVVTTVKSPVQEVNHQASTSEIRTVILKDDNKHPKVDAVRTLKVEEPKAVPLKAEDNVAVAPTTSQISPKPETAAQESNAPTKGTIRKGSADRDVEKVEVEQDTPNNNNKNEKAARKSSEASHASDETSRPARVTRRRSRESTESQQSTANSDSGRSTRSTRRRGASESSDISISSDGHNADMRSTPSTRSSVDRSESPPRASRHSTRSSTRKRTSADREETAPIVTAATVKGEKERSASPAPGKGTRASKRKLVMEEAAEDHDGKKAKTETASATQSDSKVIESIENDSRTRRNSAKADIGKSAMKEPILPSARRAANRVQKTETIELADDHTYSGTRRANTRSTMNAVSMETKDESNQKKIPAAAKKDDKVPSRAKGKPSAVEEKSAAADDAVDSGAKRSTRSTRNKDRTELPPPPPTKRQRSARDH